MRKDNKILTIIIFTITGIAISSYLSIAELSGGTTCPLISSIAGIPIDVIELVMYLVTFFMALMLYKETF